MEFQYCGKEFMGAVPWEECVSIVVVDNTRFYHRLRFALLASTWLPKPLGVPLWSVLHLLLLLCWTVLVPPAVITWVTIRVLLDALVHTGVVVVYGVVAPLSWLFLVAWCFVTCHPEDFSNEIFLTSWRSEAWIKLWSGTLRWVDVFPFIGTFIEELILPWFPEWRLLLKRWCGEVVHIYGAISI